MNFPDPKKYTIFGTLSNISKSFVSETP